MKEDEWEFANKGGLFQLAVAADGNPWAWLDSEIKNHINKWNHATIVWDGKELHHFINGKKGKSHALRYQVNLLNRPSRLLKSADVNEGGNPLNL